MRDAGFDRRAGARVLVLAVLLAVAGAGPASAAERCQRGRILEALERQVPRGKALAVVCGDVIGGRPSEVAVTIAGPAPYGATRWRLFRRTRAGAWTHAAGGRVSGSSRGLLSVVIRRDALRVEAPLWRRADLPTCPTGGRLVRTLRWRSGGLRLVRTRRLRATGECAPAPRPAGPPASRRCRQDHPALPDVGVRVNRDVSRDMLGKVLPGTSLRSTEAPHRPPRPRYVSDLLATYPHGRLPAGPPAWTDVPDATSSRYVHATAAGALFNSDDARHRVAHDQAYAGLSPIGIGDIDGDGVEDLAQTAHWSSVDGVAPVGEVHVFLGRRHPGRIDPRRHVPDLILYGERAFDKFGIEVAPAGDTDGDGFDDFLIAAAFRSTTGRDGRQQPYGSAVYLVHGGPGLLRYRCPVKVRAEDIGRKLPGVVLEGGHDGSAFLGWTNTLDSGDFDGDGLSDVVLGAYEMHTPRLAAPFRARAYVIYGSRKRLRGTRRLGVRNLGRRESVIELPDDEGSHASTGYQTSFAGDLDGDGLDELAISAARGGAAQTGMTWIFGGRRERLSVSDVTAVAQADLRIVGDDDTGGVRHRGIAGARPAGDVNGDGLPDLQVSARGSTRNGTVIGAVGVMYGARQLPRGEIGFSTLPVILLGQRPGSSAAFPGQNTGADLDRDGFADLLINDPYFVEPIGDTRQYRGRLWLVRGGPTLPARGGVEDVASRVFLADTRVPGLFGFQWNTGDFNADGRSDILIGDHYLGDRGTRERPGGAYLYYGGADF